ncbi:hypothetical protein SKAU_G00331990 [Synaphobranchus kaupii]|uniref:Ig-like domain-containing protein n=1 Tax=Synaphobranchus kaupii TaxID=118154 RepID=A0A9Q1ELD7_SYNKA|nr:hypothetical protein SKAU_G00331990 [Synaphobranchus kaupii]
MIRCLNAFTIILYSLTGLSFGNSVHQSPSTLLNHTGESVQLSCSHNIPNYDTILWYQQPQEGNGMKLIGRVYFNNPEMEGEKRFNMSGDGRRQAFLHIDKLEAEDSCTYFCAVTKHGSADSLPG